MVVLVLGLAAACTTIENPTGPSRTTTTTTTAAPRPVATDQIEFRVFGSGLLQPIVIRHLDPVNGLTITTSNSPYLATVTSTDPNAFVYLEGSSFGFSTSVLQVQIFVNGKLFREGSSIGSVLFASASGTVHHP